jgi:hypothetical protein
MYHFTSSTESSSAVAQKSCRAAMIPSCAKRETSVGLANWTCVTVCGRLLLPFALRAASKDRKAALPTSRCSCRAWTWCRLRWNFNHTVCEDLETGDGEVGNISVFLADGLDPCQRIGFAARMHFRKRRNVRLELAEFRQTPVGLQVRRGCLRIERCDSQAVVALNRSTASF